VSALALVREREAEAAAARPLRLLYVVSLFPCWSETFIEREISELLRRGVDVQIASLRPPSEALVQSDARALLGRVLYPPSFRNAVGRVLSEVRRAPGTNARFLVELVRGLWRTPAGLLKSLVTWWRVIALAESLREHAPDLIHAHWATYPSTAALLLSRLTGIPFSFTAHAHDIFVEDHLLAAKLRESRFAVTISEFNRRFLAERLGPAACGRVELVRCGIELGRIPFERDGREESFLLSVGRLDPIKGFPFLLEACARLKAEGRAFRCEIVGDGPLRGGLEAQLRSLGLEDRVRLLPACGVEEVLERLRRATLFVLPSVVAPDGNRDGVPVALMEAMASGAPVVSTGVSGIPELVEDGTSGLLVAPGDAVSLAAAIASLLDDPRRARALAERARRAVEQAFNLEAETRRLMALMEGAVAGERRP
jgi:colanic acid/amylovoran biosynthesis glycosyltransferase